MMNVISREMLKKHWKVMKAYKKGSTIEVSDINGKNWLTIENPAFNVDLQYRVKKQKKSNRKSYSSIVVNWNNIDPIYKWFAVDRNGDGYVYADIPYYDSSMCAWLANSSSDFVSNYGKNMDNLSEWKQSLQERPKGI